MIAKFNRSVSHSAPKIAPGSPRTDRVAVGNLDCRSRILIARSGSVVPAPQRVAPAVHNISQSPKVQLETFTEQYERESTKPNNATCQLHLDLTHSRPLPAAPKDHTRPTATWPIIARPPPALLLLIKHQLQDVVRELGELEIHGLELWLRAVARAVAPCGLERSDRLADRLVVGVGFLVYKACVCELALGGRGCAVDLGVCERLEFGEAEALGQCADAGVVEETGAVIARDGLMGVFLEGHIASRRGSWGSIRLCKGTRSQSPWHRCHSQGR